VGVDSSAVIDASSRECREGYAVWKEYYRKIKVPETVDVKDLTARLREAAGRYHLDVTHRDDGAGTTVMEMRRGDKVLSRLVFVVAAKKTVPVTPEKPRKRFALVIDDVGGERDLSQLIDLGIPLTFAIMPYERYSRKIARDLEDRKMPYILHLPMQPDAYPKVDPGKAALLISMTDEQVRKKFAADLATVPGARGVSNHMGSRFSRDPEKMKVLLEQVKAQGLFYFDSRTTPQSLAGKAAKTAGVPCGANDLFVDIEDTPEYMGRQFDRILKTFSREGRFIAIGHVQKKSLAPVLKEYIPKFKKAGVEFVYLTDLVSPEHKK
jgi:polysaccharide deacetylase 2 family uncharacterized protein YibQ